MISNPSKHIAVLGGGLTGLSSVFHLSRRFPTSQITLVEKERTLGGWVRSERVEIPEVEASVLLEGGPRTLRPNAKSVLELVNLLDLEEELLTVSKAAPPARQRYLYIPTRSTTDRKIAGLQVIPSTMWSLLSSPLRSILLTAVLSEPFKRSNRPAGITDESLDSFMARRFGERFAHTFGSAIIHGIYASDSRKISVKAALPSLWNAEENGWGRVLLGMFRHKSSPAHDYDVGNVETRMKDVSVYSFKDGMETLTRRLESEIRSRPNVTIRSEASICSVDIADGLFTLRDSKGDLSATHVVSAMPLPALQKIISSQSSSFPHIPHLQANPLATVRVVNLILPLPPSQVHPEGFGYLIPRPVDGYPTDLSQTTGVGILGVVFDSCSLHQQDNPSVQNYYKESKHTKLTVMMGGPYAHPPLPSALQGTASQPLPSLLQQILEELSSHLGTTLPQPTFWKIWDNQNCIPTLLPGHLGRVEEMNIALDSKLPKEIRRRFVFAGASVGGVSIGDCVEAGKRAGSSWTDQ